MAIINKYKKTEQWLYRFSALRAYLEKIKEEYAELETAANGSAIEYDKDKLCETFAFSSSTENLALELYKKSIKIKHVSAKIKAVENAMDILNEDERLIITLKYMESQPWYVIGYKVQYSESQSKRIRRRAIRKICVALFGEEDDPNMTQFDTYSAV